MKHWPFILLLCAVVCCICAQAQDAAKKPDSRDGGIATPPAGPSYESLRGKASFATGFEVGFSMCSYVRENECDDVSLYEGIADALHSRNKMTPKEMRKLSSEYKASIFKSRQAQKKGFEALVGEEMLKKGSYATGVSLVEFYVLRDSFRHELDEEQLMKGFRAGIAEGRRAANEMADRKKIIQEFEKLRDVRRAVGGKANLAAGEKFLAENAKRKGVISMPSGLQYRVLKATDDKNAQSPEVEDLIKVHYRGRLVDGTEFDSTYKREMPSTFPLSGNLKAWAEALPRMKVGDRWELYVPAKLGYGDQAQPPHIGANAVLIFEVELLGVQRRPKSKE